MKLFREILFVTFHIVYFIVISIPICILLIIGLCMIDIIKRAGVSLALDKRFKNNRYTYSK
jgi:hypothetical protein